MMPPTGQRATTPFTKEINASAMSDFLFVPRGVRKHPPPPWYKPVTFERCRTKVPTKVCLLQETYFRMMPSTPNWANGDDATAEEIDASMMSRLAASLFGEGGAARS